MAVNTERNIKSGNRKRCNAGIKSTRIEIKKNNKNFFKAKRKRSLFESSKSFMFLLKNLFVSLDNTILVSVSWGAWLSVDICLIKHLNVIGRKCFY